MITHICVILQGNVYLYMKHVDKVCVNVWSVQMTLTSLTYKNEGKKEEKSANTSFGLKSLQLGVSTSFVRSTVNAGHCSTVNW